VGASLLQEKVEGLDSELKQLLKEKFQAFDETVLQIPHRAFAVIASAP